MCRTAEENRVEADQLKRIDKGHQSSHDTIAQWAKTTENCQFAN